MKNPFKCLCLISILSFGLVLLSPNFCVAKAPTDVNKPSVPEFSVRFVSYPYDVPEKTVTTVDQYTGKETVKTTPGYRVENKSIEIVVKNQPFTPYNDEEGHRINLYYSVRVKGHFGDDWTEIFSTTDVRGFEYWGSMYKSPVQSSSEYTVLSVSADYPEDAQVDYQVRAHSGYYTKYYPAIIDAYIWVFKGEYSDWSSTQTFSFAEKAVIPEFPSWIVLPLFVSISTVVIVCRTRLSKAKKTGVIT